MDHATLRSRPVVLTTDCGTEMDDQWALAHLALSSAIQLQAVITNHAPNVPPPASEATARAASHVLDHLPLHTRPPVIAGSSEALPDRQSPRPNPGVDAILALAREHTPENRLILLSIGTATDIASAMLLEPDSVDRIEIVAMAFDGWPDGNDGWNVRNDIPAWQVVMGSRAPLTVGDAAVCKRCLSLTVSEARERLTGCGRGGDFLVALFADWLAVNQIMAKQVTGDESRWPVWDEVVVGHLLGLTASTLYVRPKLRGDTTFDLKDAAGNDLPPVRWITDLDTEGLWSDLRTRLQQGNESCH